MAAAGHALEQALAYYRAPALLAMAAQRPLPDDVIELLRLAAGDAAQASTSAEASGESPQRVVEAAVFFVQQVMFIAEAGPHRVLGVNPDAPPARIREHYRWLIRWLHPDRNGDDWDSVYTDRVTRAWRSLRRSGALAGEGEAGGESAGRRAPLRPEAPAAAPSVRAATGRAHRTREQAAVPRLSARTARRLPGFVLGGLGLIAVSLVAFLWYAQQVPIKPPLLAGGASAAKALPAATAASVPPPESPVEGPYVPTAPATPQAPPPLPLESERPPVSRIAAAPPPAPAFQPSSTAPAATRPSGGSAPFPKVPAAPDVQPAQRVEDALPLTETPLPLASDPRQFADIQQASAHAVLARFSAAYRAGDLTALMRLFTRDAINNRGGRDAIAYDYQSLFDRSRERRLDLQPNGWMIRDDDAVVLANYDAWVKASRLRPGSTLSGTIRFTLRREDGELRISQVIHD